MRSVPRSAIRDPRSSGPGPEETPGIEDSQPAALNAERGTLFPRPTTLWQGLQLPLTWTAITLVRLYQLGISPGIPSSCRFAPSCSQYMLEALQRHHALKGILLGTWRLLRCHPWHPGGYDPVP